MENLIIYGRYFDLSYGEARRRATELLDFVQLGDRADAEVEPLSGGMKRRLTIARGLINEPEAMLLDEPTTGLDPQSRLQTWGIVEELIGRGRTALVTTWTCSPRVERRGSSTSSSRKRTSGSPPTSDTCSGR